MTLLAPSLTAVDDLTTPDPFQPPIEGQDTGGDVPTDPAAEPSPWDDPKYAAEEIRHAEAHAARHHAPLKRIVEQYAGGMWYRDTERHEPTPENHAFAWVDWMEPRLAYAAPAANVEANWEKSHGQIAQWMEKSERRWGAMGQLVNEFKPWVRDALFGYGVLMIGLESCGDGGKVQPFIEHVPADQWICDPRDEHLARVLFEARRREVDLRDLGKIRGADPAVVATVKSTYDSGGERVTVGLDKPATAERKRVTVYYVWIREEKRIGVLLSTGGKDPKDQWLSKPVPWWGHPRGPFVKLGFKTVPGDPFPMSPLQAVMTQINNLNLHLRAESLEAQSFKTGLGVDAGNTDAKEAIEKGESNGIWIIPGLSRGAVQQLSLGGVHPQRLEHTERLKDRVQRFLALGDSQQGIASGKTATADLTARQASDTRIEGMRGVVHTAAADAFERVMWWMFYDPSYESRITVDQTVTDPMSGQVSTQPAEGYMVGGTDGGWYRGEFFPPMVDVSWPEDFTVTVDPDSTSHTADQQKQQDALTLMQVQQTAYQMLQTMPGADVEWSVNKVGESMNIRDLFSKLMTAQLVQQAQMMNPQAPVGLPAGASPAMAPGLVHAQGGMGPALPMGAAGGMMGGGMTGPGPSRPPGAGQGQPGSPSRGTSPTARPGAPGRPAFA